MKLTHDRRSYHPGRCGAVASTAEPRRRQRAAEQAWPARTEHPLPRLQQSLGNQAAQQRAAGCPAIAACPTGGACHPCLIRAQAKLRASEPGDRFEQEADRLANRVVNTTPPTAPAAAATRPPPAAADGAILGGGESLPPSVRARFEPGFGYDFGHVRVHTGPGAAASAEAIGALAYTSGSDVVFGPGQYAPDTTAGQRLLAHELTHVIQQGPTSARRSVLGQHLSSVSDRRVMRQSSGCTRKVTGVNNADALIAQTRSTAQTIVSTATGNLKTLNSETHRLLDRHFHCPGTRDVLAIRATFDQIATSLPTLAVTCVGAAGFNAGESWNVEGGTVNLSPDVFAKDDLFRIAILIGAAARLLGKRQECAIYEPCYNEYISEQFIDVSKQVIEDETQTAVQTGKKTRRESLSSMLNNFYSYAYFAIEASSLQTLEQPPTIPCHPVDTGLFVMVPLDIVGYPEQEIEFYRPPTKIPKGYGLISVYVDQGNKYFIYEGDVFTLLAETKRYLPGEAPRYYFREGGSLYTSIGAIFQTHSATPGSP